MGVKELWTVLSPVCLKKSLWELGNKKIAIDLSAWICDSQNVGDNSQRNMYLRNLFFRTTFLLLLDAKPLFVLEGVAPELKHNAIVARSQVRNGNSKEVKCTRSRLKSLQTQCEKLLKTMGVPCVRGPGEAEAYCAWLNENKIVDAVITQDSDIFLYGGETVYRNFTMSPSFTCDAYEMAVIEEKLNLGRNKLLAISLLCGCDYIEGVKGVGKESAVKFLTTLEEIEVLDRLRSWSSDPKYDAMILKGNSQLTPVQKLEINIRKKALQIPGFPSEDIINEYLSEQSCGTVPPVEWLKPNLPKFLEMACRQLSWEEKYAIEKFLPLMTRWHLLNPDLSSVIHCDSIVKKRIVRGVNCYECLWSAPEVIFGETDVILTTNEPQHLIHKTYSDLADDFVKSKVKPSKKGVKARSKKDDKRNVVNDNTADVQNLLHNLSIDEETENVKQPNKRRIKNKAAITVKSQVNTLDKYLKPNQKDISSEERQKIERQLNEIYKDLFSNRREGESLLHSTPKRVNTLSANEIEDNHLNVSNHYEHVSPSPLKHKIPSSFDATTQDNSILKTSIDVSERWSLNNYVHLKENSARKIKKDLFDETMTESFLNTSDNNDHSVFDLSGIVNNIVSSENSAVYNVATKILLDSAKYIE